MKNLKILFVDDEKSLLFGVRSLLKNSDYDSDIASNINEAKKLIKLNNYNIIITDLRLGNIDYEEGLEIIRFAKQIKDKIYTILWTAYGTKKIKEKAALLGIDYYLEKPVLSEKLFQILNTINKNINQKGD